MLKADLHCHTNFSKCSSMSPEKLVNMAIARGIDVLGVVDHDDIRGAEAVRKAAGNRLLVIPGEEITTDRGHLIVFLSDGKFSRNAAEICERAKKMGAFTVAPHPYDFLRRTGLGKALNGLKVDAVEVFNSRAMLSMMNRRAEAYAIKRGLPMVVGSDAHHPQEVGLALNLFECEKSVGSVLESIRKGKVRFVRRKGPWTSHFKTMTGLAGKKFS